ncbi:MAG TPA: CHAT domain-containing protein, partial [Longimicrobium sp.]|nr:CHAT domain-containing protein [Longimicrobium sp.]
MRRYVVLALVAALLCAAAISRSLPASHGNPVRRLARATPERVFAPRLSIPTEYRRCTPLPAHGDETVPRERCEASEETPLELAALASAGESHDPALLQASALAGVVWWDETEASLDAAISRLGKALRLSPGSVPLLADLSAAHLVRAERTQNPRDLFAGLEFAYEALAREPGNAAARFNAALALQALGVDEQAAHAWHAYLEIDSTSPWADEARRRKQDLITQAAAVREPTAGTSPAEVTAFAANHPQEARVLGWDRVLGDWGTAVEEGDAARAASLLELAEGLGRALEQRRGGDASLADAVRAIRAAAPGTAATLWLARAHRAYARGRAHYQLDHRAAFDAFTLVVDSRPSSPALLQWATAFRAGALVYLSRRDEAEAAIRALLPRVDAARHPGLKARTRWILATVLLRTGRRAEASAEYRSAAALFGGAGETELMGAMLGMDGEATYERGDSLAAYQTMHEALRVLRPYRQSVWLHGHLLTLARIANRDGMRRASAVIHDEDVSVALRAGTSLHPLEALQARAWSRALRGDSLGAARDLETAAASVGKLPAGPREWGTMVLRFSRAAIGSGKAAPGAAAAMDSAVDYFARNNVVWLFPAVLRRADARLAAGDVAGATADLETVTSYIRGLTGKESDARLRGAMVEQARSRFDQLVMLHLRAGRMAEALRVLERGRISFAPQREGGAGATGRLAAPPGEVAVEYALIRDTLLTWTLRGDTIHLLRRPVDRDTFLLVVEQASAALESPERAAAAAPALRRLYDWLIRPVRGRLGPPETPLVVLADGEVAGVPFAALMDARGRYLVDDHPLRFAATLADAARPVPARSGPALLVADPAFDAHRYPTLDRLQGAQAEVESLGLLYPGHVRLEGSGATRHAFAVRARSAGLIHYAGHAVFDDARPERSFLVLAGADTTGRLTAEAVNTMRLDGVRLVVLSAC